jgi:hypothetical protein
MRDVLLSSILDLLMMLGMAVAAGGLYALLVGGLVAAIPVPGNRRRSLMVLLSLLISVMALSVVLTMFQAVSFSLRGRATDFEVFVFWGGVAFFTLYGTLLVLSAVVGYILGSRRTGEGPLTGGITAVALALFLALTFPVVEFANSCFVGRAIILSAMC